MANVSCAKLFSYWRKLDDKTVAVPDTTRGGKKLVADVDFGAGETVASFGFLIEITDEERAEIINYFGADPQINSSHMIALEFTPHWKSGKIKEVIQYGN